MSKINVKETSYEVLGIVGLKPESVIFTYDRIDPATVPDDLHVYEVREDGFGKPGTIEPHVGVNFGGTIISIDEIPMGEYADEAVPADAAEDLYYELTEDNFGYEGWECDFEDYVDYQKYLKTNVGLINLNFGDWYDEREEE